MNWNDPPASCIFDAATGVSIPDTNEIVNITEDYLSIAATMSGDQLDAIADSLSDVRRELHALRWVARSPSRELYRALLVMRLRLRILGAEVRK